MVNTCSIWDQSCFSWRPCAPVVKFYQPGSNSQQRPPQKLGFLYPLKRIQTELSTRLKQDTTVVSIYKWIKVFSDVTMMSPLNDITVVVRRYQSLRTSPWQRYVTSLGTLAFRGLLMYIYTLHTTQAASAAAPQLCRLVITHTHYKVWYERHMSPVCPAP